MLNQNLFFLILSIIVVIFILLVGIFLAEQMLFYALFAFLLALVVMGFGFYLKRKWNSQ